jgi:hypothetical protein
MAELKIKADSGGGTVSFKGPATTTSNAAVQLTLPVDDGTTGQYLKTDGSGALSWATVDTSIADDSLTEAKLDIHAAPSGTDKFLGYTANGMEWAVPPDTGLTWTTSSTQTADNTEANYLWDSIPATAVIIVVHFADLKSNSSSTAYMRVGTSAAWLETGDKYDYSAGYINHDGSTGADQNDNKIRLFRGDSDANTRRHGNITFMKAGDNYWTWSHMGGHDHNNSHMSFSAGDIEVGAALTRIILMCNSGNWASGKIWMSYLG